MKKIETRKVPVVSKPKSNLVAKLLNDDLKPIYITPVHVLIISLLFIANVFLLHLYSRFGSKSSLFQVIFAILMVVLSFYVGISLNKKSR